MVVSANVGCGSRRDGAIAVCVIRILYNLIAKQIVYADNVPLHILAIIVVVRCAVVCIVSYQSHKVNGVFSLNKKEPEGSLL